MTVEEFETRRQERVIRRAERARIEKMARKRVTGDVLAFAAVIFGLWALMLFGLA